MNSTRANSINGAAAPHRRSFLVTVAYCGFSLAAASGFLVAWMIPEFGWRSMLILGGVLPLILVPFLYWKTRESITYLVKQSYSQDKIKAILKRLFPHSMALN